MHRKTLRIVTYNIHRCRGMDGRTLPQRAIDVLAGLNADIIALQEVIGAGPNDSGHAEEIGAALGMGWVMASVRHLRGHQFGNVVLSHFPIRQHVQYDLSWRTCEPRCCQRVDILIEDKTLHLFNVHLGTAYRERKDQAERLAAIVHDGRIAPPKILLGDFNEWSGGLATAALTKKLRGHRPERVPAAQAHLSRHPACSCTSITSTTKATSRSPASKSRARGNR